MAIEQSNIDSSTLSFTGTDCGLERSASLVGCGWLGPSRLPRGVRAIHRGNENSR